MPVDLFCHNGNVLIGPGIYPWWGLSVIVSRLQNGTRSLLMPIKKYNYLVHNQTSQWWRWCLTLSRSTFRLQTPGTGLHLLPSYGDTILGFQRCPSRETLWFPQTRMVIDYLVVSYNTLFKIGIHVVYTDEGGLFVFISKTLIHYSA